MYQFYVTLLSLLVKYELKLFSNIIAYLSFLSFFVENIVSNDVEV